MLGVIHKILKAWLFAMLAFGVSAPLAAQDGAVPSCHAYSDAPMTAQSALSSLRWTCGQGGWEDGRAVTWLRFDEWDRDAPPAVFSSRMTVFSQLSVTEIGRDGSLRSRTYTLDHARPVRAGPVFTVPLPEARDDTAAYLVAIDRPHSVTVASEARLDQDPETDSALLTNLLVLAIITGMLIMPLLFDSLFYLVLRERFVLLHAAMTLSMIGYILTSGGVATAFVTLPVHFLAVAGPICWAAGVGFAGLFAVAFLEPDALPNRIRRLFFWTGIWAMVVPGITSLQFDWMQPFGNQVYFYAFAPVIPIYFAGLVYAVTRGSRAARFLTIAWIPVIAASTDRLLRGMGLYGAGNSIDSLLFFALAFEVITIALGVADRFIAIRRQRDRAVIEARALGELTERDPLTGLLNRRALEERFARLRSKGFNTLAVLDIDRFKDINDNFGHATGDLVLRAVAEAMQPDEDTCVVRLGGEEFAILLRGRHAQARAERRRQAITTHVAGRVPLDRPVTASMGVVETCDHTNTDGDFTMLYRHADRLLYEAKRAGRNRTLSEKLSVFRPRRGDRRAA